MQRDSSARSRIDRPHTVNIAVRSVYDPKTRLAAYAFTQKLVPKMYTVILTAKVNRKWRHGGISRLIQRDRSRPIDNKRPRQ
jgi:hypothetical protein